MGWAGLLPTVYPWVQAFIWAFKPTDVIDIRRFPAEEAKAHRRGDARLRGKPRVGAARGVRRRRRASRPRRGPGREGLERVARCCSASSSSSGTASPSGWSSSSSGGSSSASRGASSPSFFVLHLLIIFLIGLRFVTPYVDRGEDHPAHDPAHAAPVGADARHRRARRAERAGQEGARRCSSSTGASYEYKVRQLEAQLAQAKQNVQVMKADIRGGGGQGVELKSELDYAQYQQKLSTDLAEHGAGPEEDAQKWCGAGGGRPGGHQGGPGGPAACEARYTSQIGGVNTTVAAIQAELDQARYYLDNTLMVAPEDGYVINLQVRPGMVSGDIRLGAIASFICDADRYLLASYFQENLKYVKPGQVVEAALDLYPGQILPGKVLAIWRGSGCRADAAERDAARFQRRASRGPAGTVRGGDQLDDRRSVQVSDRHPGPRRDLHESAQRLRHPSQDRASAPTHGSTGCTRSPVDAGRLARRTGGRRGGGGLRAEDAAAARRGRRRRRCRRRRRFRRRGRPTPRRRDRHRRLAEDLRRPGARGGRCRGDREQPGPAPGGRPRERWPSRGWSSSGRGFFRRWARSSADARATTTVMTRASTRGSSTPAWPGRSTSGGSCALSAPRPRPATRPRHSTMPLRASPSPRPWPRPGSSPSRRASCSRSPSSRSTIYQKLADLVSIRRAAGKDSDLDVYDARARLASAMSEVESARENVRGGPPRARSAARALSRRGDRCGRDLPAPFGASADGRSRESPPAPTRRRRGRAGSARGFSPGRRPRDWRFCPISRSRSSAAGSATSFSRCCD